MADTQKIYLGDNLFNNMALGNDMVVSLYAEITPATLFIDAAGITDNTQQLAIDNLFNDLYTNNLWNKFYALWPLVGGTSTTHQYNMVDVSTNNLTFNGAWVHNSDGITGDGTNTFINTNVSLSSLPTSFATGAMGIYSSTSGQDNYDMGCFRVGNEQYALITRYNSDIAISLHGSGDAQASNLDGSGFFVGQASATDTGIYKDGSALATGSFSSQAAPARDVYIGALNENGTAREWTSRTYSLSFIADAFTAAEISTLYTIVQDYQTTLGREV